MYCIDIYELSLSKGTKANLIWILKKGLKYSKLWDVLSYLGDEKYWKFLVEMVENIEIQVHKQLQPICAVLNKSIYCCCMVSAWTYFLLASLLFPPWILENIFNILYIMQVLAKSLGILWCTKNEKIVKNQHKNLMLKSILFVLLLNFAFIVESIGK